MISSNSRCGGLNWDCRPDVAAFRLRVELTTVGSAIRSALCPGRWGREAPCSSTFHRGVDGAFAEPATAKTGGFDLGATRFLGPRVSGGKVAGRDSATTRFLHSGSL